MPRTKKTPVDDPELRLTMRVKRGEKAAFMKAAEEQGVNLTTWGRQVMRKASGLNK